jgi:hypothetical protein
MEDASGEDLDWFWRGWFYGTDACDISIDSVKHFTSDVSAVPNQRDTAFMRSLDKPRVNSFEDVSKIRNRENNKIRFATDADTTLRDFYWKYDRNLVPYDTAKYAVPTIAGATALDDAGKAKYENKHFYEISFSNKGGLMMPIIIEWTYTDGTKEVERIPAQVWRLNEKKVVKSFMKDKEVASVRLDPMRETADIDESNNSWNTMPTASKFQIFKQRQLARGQSPTGVNPMQKAAEKKAF